MKHFAVIGHPIGHSLSPLMHNSAFRLLGLDYQYESLDIEPASLEQSMKQFRSEDWIGINVTVPHKEAIMPFLDEITTDARTIGAVNTVAHRHQKLIGYNTDVIGVEKSLQPFRERILGQKCLIIGSGGAARSVTYVLTHKIRVKEITFAVLLQEQADLLAGSFMNTDVKFQIIPSRDADIETTIKNCTLIVNATTAGMYPNIHESPISNQQWITKEHIVFDVIYRPLKTRLINEANKAGAVTIGGLEMFIQQGAAAFQIWTEKELPYDEIRRILEEKLAS